MNESTRSSDNDIDESDSQYEREMNIKMQMYKAMFGDEESADKKSEINYNVK